MSPYFSYILLAIIVFLVVAILVFLVGRNKSENRLTPLAGLAFGFILAGVLFGENRILGYGLMLVGIVIAVFDIYTRARAK